MGRGRGTGTLAVATAAHGVSARARVGDPIVTQIVALLREHEHGRASREQRESLEHAGLLRAGSSGFSGPRTVPTTLGKIMIEKGRLPTKTEIARAAKQLDAELKRCGVKGDVAGGGYSYQEASSPAAHARQLQLIRDRQKIPAFLRAQTDGQFEAVRLPNARARAAQTQLADRLDKLTIAGGYAKYYEEQATKVRSGVFSVADARNATQTLTSYRESADEVTAREAIRLGLGLPSTREQLTAERARESAGLGRLLDRVCAGERVASTDGEVEWSQRGVSDGRVRRAAFGYCESADRIQADYYQRGLIELHDGTISTVVVKRAGHDLEGYVDEVIEDAQLHAENLAAAAQLEEKAAKLLRRWTRT